ncbi:NAD(P)-dependent oxidoreductase [Streptomyces sp. H27-C3]|uniref:NAD-dependent epimerase/dehydratase family protein n=1 Tax=Streptomyces sp. H27-C3 TaxID=3046305 RepID=UPI0024BAFB73|nr:NAD(P)-dependent oxidoreductase [Streptomyces sp. H27-C3]MDJ0465861.1 NAD(P)-dependent oxidoreductase [Streptomyces sp. H27-C3]
MTHPRRLAAAEEIAAKDVQGRIRVVTDPDPSGPPTALRTANPSWSCVGDAATHHIVFQDDVVLADGFFPYAEKIAAAAPGEAVAFYEGWEGRNSGVVRLGALTGAHWAYAIDEHVPSLALMLPAEVARSYAQFAAQHGGGWPYDVVVQRCLKTLGVPVRLAVPSTVDHDDVPSLAGNSKHGWRRATYFSDSAGEAPTSECSSFSVVPFYQYGESKCAVRYGARWEYLDTDRYLRRIGLSDSCDAGFAGIGQRGLPTVVCRQAWLTAFATGVAVADLTSQSPDPAVARAVMDSLGPGGLCEEYTGMELLPMIPKIRELALEALESGIMARRAAGHRAVSLTGVTGTSSAPVVVTGGSGEFGAQLARLLTDAGCGANFSERLDSLQGQEVRALIHLGDRHGSGPGVADVLAHAEKLAVERVIHLSSADVYRGADADACTEASLPTTGPRDVEARAWWDAEQVCLLWGNETDTPVQIVRLAEQVGPHAPSHGVLATWMLQAWTRRPMVLVEGRRHQLVDHRDIAGALAAILEGPARSPIYNIASALYEESELAQLAAETARRTPWEQEPADGAPFPPSMSTALITAETGWQATAPLHSGARAQAQWLACDIHDPGPDAPRRSANA